MLSPPAHQPRLGSPRAERAVAHYLAAADEYAAAVTRKAEGEAAAFLAGGPPGSAIGTGWAHLKSDGPGDRLRAYRQRLRELVTRGAYDGPVELTRLRPDGSWEPLHLPGDRR